MLVLWTFVNKKIWCSMDIVIETPTTQASITQSKIEAGSNSSADNTIPKHKVHGTVEAHRFYWFGFVFTGR